MSYDIVLGTQIKIKIVAYVVSKYNVNLAARSRIGPKQGIPLL